MVKIFDLFHLLRHRNCALRREIPVRAIQFRVQFLVISVPCHPHFTGNVFDQLSNLAYQRAELRL
ncbi:Uncharacterised protein [Vibrio cholerae]|nr:Uncharacterised protein [Vibrio cholerae]